jgi:cysteine desulfuration protein SufE
MTESTGVNEVAERQKKIVEEFAQLTTWEEKYEHLIKIGKALPGLSEADRQDRYLVKGCQSQVWLKAALEEQNRVAFQADSDAVIVRGLIGLLLRVYSGASTRDVITSSPQFLREIGFDTSLSASRANGLFAMVKQMMLYAQAYEMMKR